MVRDVSPLVPPPSRLPSVVPSVQRGLARLRVPALAIIVAGCGTSGGYAGPPDGGHEAGSGGPPEVGVEAGDEHDPVGIDEGQPAGWDDELRVALAPDMNPDPNIVEVQVTAQTASLSLVPGGPTTVWSYNGLLPGPMIRARVGNRVIVHFTNNLPADTTIHWHGLRVPAAMDGMPGHSQPPVAPGGHFDYDFEVPDASTFWYHPHVDAAEQVGNGLYAPFIVDDPAEPQDLGDEVVMVLSDMALEPNGALSPADQGGDINTLFGREGNLLLVNGKVKPTLRARPGRPQRWRLINAAKSRYFQISLPGHKFVRIGGDGGLMTSPVSVDMPVIAPAERADLIVTPSGSPGDDVVAQWVAYDHGFGTAFNRPPQDLFVVHLEGTPVEPRGMPSIHRDIVPLSTAGATPVDIQLTHQSNDPLQLGINGVAFSDAAPVFTAHVGETQVWSVTNTFDWAHPFHMHGFFFQVLADDGTPRMPLEWKDTVDVPVDKTVRFVIHYDDRPGMWMFHCHILDHADAGMMAMLMVEPASAP